MLPGSYQMPGIGKHARVLALTLPGKRGSTPSPAMTRAERALRREEALTTHQPHSTVSSFSVYSCGVGTKPFRFLLNTWMLLVLQ